MHVHSMHVHSINCIIQAVEMGQYSQHLSNAAYIEWVAS